MNLFSIVSNAWKSLNGSTTVNTVAPVVNIDGTPMLNDTMDIKGNPFGVTDTSTSMDCGGMLDSGSTWSGGGFSDF